MKTLTEHEDFYSRLSDAGEKLLDKIEAKLDKGRGPVATLLGQNGGRYGQSRWAHDEV